MAYYPKAGQITPQRNTYHGVTVGTVVDTNDPQQMGRVRAVCPMLNDRFDAIITDIPWASYATPFGGTVQKGTRGPDDTEVGGPVAYGMWATPKVGTQVLVMCLDGNPQTRVWVGCLHTQLATHTMPHGRFSFKDDTNLPDEEKPVGPFNTFETSIEPLHTNLRTAFGTAPEGEENFEFATRGADFQVSGVGLGQLESTLSVVEDDQDDSTGSAGSLSESRQGYQTSRIAPDQFTSLTPRNLDNTVTALVSPGFHAVSMDDRQENCRVRVRTTAGHQIIMDDTNERVYISTSTGENWIEMDQQGNIDIYTSGKISAHAEHDINFTTDRSFRVYAKAGIHLKSDKEFRVTAEEDVSLKTNASLRARSTDDMLFQSADKDIHLKAAADIFADASRGTIHGKSKTLTLEGSSAASVKSGGEINVQAGGNANIVGSKVNLNSGGSAASADQADQADPNDDFNAFFTNRIPEHEPWARSDTKADDTTDPLDDYTGSEVGKRRRITSTDGTGEETPTITRGENWRR